MIAVLFVLLALLLTLDWVREGSFLRRVLPGDDRALWTEDFVDQLRSGEAR